MLRIGVSFPPTLVRRLFHSIARREGTPRSSGNPRSTTFDHISRKLDESDEANRENRRIIAALTQRIPAIEAPADEPSELRESAVSESEDEGKGDVPPEPGEDKIRQSW